MFSDRAGLMLLAFMVSVAAPTASRAQSQRPLTSEAAESPSARWRSCARDGSTDVPPEPGRGRARIVVNDGMVSADIRDCQVADVLALISDLANVRIEVAEVLPERRISVRLEPQSIQSALGHLLSSADIFALYRAEHGTQQLTAVWVYPSGSSDDVAPVPRHLWASTREFESQLADQDPEIRGRAIEELIMREGEAALPRVLDALADPDAQVRHRALDAALGSDLDVPVEYLQLLLTNDPSPE